MHDEHSIDYFTYKSTQPKLVKGTLLSRPVTELLYEENVSLQGRSNNMGRDSLGLRLGCVEADEL